MLLRKGVHPYEYMDSWERFNETSLLNKENFYSCLNMEDITDIDDNYAKEVFREFRINNLDDYDDLYVKSDTLLLADMFENFRNMCLDSMAILLKKDRSRIRIFTDPNILVMVEEWIRGGITQVSQGYARANNKYMKNYNKMKILHF